MWQEADVLNRTEPVGAHAAKDVRDSEVGDVSYTSAGISEASRENRPKPLSSSCAKTGTEKRNRRSKKETRRSEGNKENMLTEMRLDIVEPPQEIP